MEEKDREERIFELVDSLRKCFDGHGDFATHPKDEDRAAQAFTTAVGVLGLDPDQFIRLVEGKVITMFDDISVIDRAKQSIRDFVDQQLED